MVDERHAGEEGVIRSDIADVIDRAAAMAAYAYTVARKEMHKEMSKEADEEEAHSGEADRRRAAISRKLAGRIARRTYTDVMRYSLDECTCPCHQDHQ